MGKLTQKDIDSNTTKTAGQAWHAFDDAEKRTAAAIEKYPGFFTNPQHISRVADIEQALCKRFGPHITLYYNARENRGRPFATLKMQNPLFGVTARRGKKEYDATMKRIAASGGDIEIKQPRSGGYIVKIT